MINNDYTYILKLMSCVLIIQDIEKKTYMNMNIHNDIFIKLNKFIEIFISPNFDTKILKNKFLIEKFQYTIITILLMIKNYTINSNENTNFFHTDFFDHFYNSILNNNLILQEQIIMEYVLDFVDLILLQNKV